MFYMASLILKPGRDKSLLKRHPWVFSGAVGAIDGEPLSGETVRINSARGDFLAWAAYSPYSQIKARVWSWEEKDVIDEAFFSRRLLRAISKRQVDTSQESALNSLSAMRLVHAESDNLPGLIIDRYSDTLVVQILSAGMETWRETITDLAVRITRIGQVYERSDVDIRIQEGLPLRSGVSRGDEPSEVVQINENGLLFFVDIKNGHKTGFYLDQRVNRSRMRNLAGSKETLDCFCYTGGFTSNLLAGGAASVVAIDSSLDAIQLGKKNISINNLPSEKVDWINGDVFYVLRSFRDARRTFDLIILDPPKFAQTASQLEKASRGYKDINLLALKLLRPGGILATFSCSGGISEDLFQKIVAGAALDAKVDAQILERLHQAPDHPTALNFPEGAYLKGFIIQTFPK